MLVWKRKEIQEMSLPKLMKTAGQEVLHLSKDSVLNQVIKKYSAPIWNAPPGDLFQEIAENIIGQQLSGGPARIITARFIKLFNKSGKKFPTPKEILDMPDQKMRDCGLSWAKVSYIKNLSEAVSKGSLDLIKIEDLPDEEVIAELVKIKGIGRWTAEMVLIFFLRRPDVFSCGDLGLCTAISKLYNIDRKDTKKIKKISEKWSPYRSLASRYLWISLDNR